MNDKIERLLRHAGLPSLPAESGDQGAVETNSDGSQDAFTTALREASQQIRKLEDMSKSTGASSSPLTQTLATDAVLNQSPSALERVGQDASRILGEGFLGGASANTGLPGELLGGGVFSLFSAISDLFGGNEQEPTPLTRYQAPPTQNFEEAYKGGVFSDAVYNSSGSVQTAPLTALALSGLQFSNPSATDPNGPSKASVSGQPAPQITVNVTAMDSRSFLDHSHDIAAAVRDAMLNMHSMNDVVTDL